MVNRNFVEYLLGLILSEFIIIFFIISIYNKSWVRSNLGYYFRLLSIEI